MTGGILGLVALLCAAWSVSLAVDVMNRVSR